MAWNGDTFTCDDATGVVDRYPYYSLTLNIGASSHLIPGHGPMSDNELRWRSFTLKEKSKMNCSLRVGAGVISFHHKHILDQEVNTVSVNYYAIRYTIYFDLVNDIVPSTIFKIKIQVNLKKNSSNILRRRVE